MTVSWRRSVSKFCFLVEAQFGLLRSFTISCIILAMMQLTTMRVSLLRQAGTLWRELLGAILLPFSRSGSFAVWVPPLCSSMRGEGAGTLDWWWGEEFLGSCRLILPSGLAAGWGKGGKVHLVILHVTNYIVQNLQSCSLFILPCLVLCSRFSFEITI